MVRDRCNILILAVGLAVLGCEPEGANAKQKAESLYGQRCVTCHGAQGKGDGPAAAPLDPKPRSFADPAWQAQRSDEEIRKVILKGGASAGLSASMPPNPDLETKPELLEALVQNIRAMRQ